MPAVDRYAEIHASHRWEVPSDFNIAQACCGRWATDRARFALYWEDEDGARAALTFFDLQQQAIKGFHPLDREFAFRGAGAVFHCLRCRFNRYFFPRALQVVPALCRLRQQCLLIHVQIQISFGHHLQSPEGSFSL